MLGYLCLILQREFKKKEKKKELKWDAQMNDSKKGHEHQAVPTMYISLNPDILKLLHVNCNIFHQETL